MKKNISPVKEKLTEYLLKNIKLFSENFEMLVVAERKYCVIVIITRKQFMISKEKNLTY
ncbi:MAG: hypothetical protein WCY14_08570 [Arcobacteraceae bacterium]